MKKYFFLLFILSSCIRQHDDVDSYDIVIYGGNASGVIAAYTASQAGKSVLLIEPGKRLGGLSSGGLGQTDIGNKYAITGLALDFYRRIGRHYGGFEQWIFEPHVAESIFRSYIEKSTAQVLYSHRLKKAEKVKNTITAIIVENSEHPDPKTDRAIAGKVFIDCSYEGDLMAKAGVSYTIGREDNRVYHETYNGVQMQPTHQFPDGVDPYKIKGDRTSGLLWGISSDTLAAIGTGDKKVQAYNFRICLTNDPANRIEIAKPKDYQPQRYELLLRLFEKRPPRTLRDFMTISLMPNHKTDINNKGAFSTDAIGMNWEYPDADHDNRKIIQEMHESYTKGFLYFVGNDPRVPKYLRDEMKQWGYPKDEYIAYGNWTPQLYIREARRMIGDYVMTQANCEGTTTVNDGIAMGAYAMDSHNTQRIVVNGMVKNEGDMQRGDFNPYPIAYRSITPKANECSNLLVPVCLSASHIAYGSIRMEPVFMVLGQSAAVAACLAIDANVTVQQVDVTNVQATLVDNPLADHRIPEILVDDQDSTSVTPFGQWVQESNARGCYGLSVLVHDGEHTEHRYVRFTPRISTEMRYDLYVYISKVQGVTEQLTLDVFDGHRSTEVTIRLADVVIKGQTTSEWVSLGTYTLPAGQKAYVDVTNKGANGAVLADAILFVPRQN